MTAETIIQSLASGLLMGLLGYESDFIVQSSQVFPFECCLDSG
jgi:hypothetical protein